jgi:hypothetical protein
VPDWDEDSPQLRENLAGVLAGIVRSFEKRETPKLESARHWHILVMKDLDVPDPRFVGAFRGEPGLENTQVKVGLHYGMASGEVAEALRRFEAKLQRLVKELDALSPPGEELDRDRLEAIIDVCAWVHAEWVRIHPFANGNGRTARLWANSVAMRYGLPPFVRLRPRPNAGYESAGARAMEGEWEATAAVFRQLLEEFLAGI